MTIKILNVGAGYVPNPQVNGLEMEDIEWTRMDADPDTKPDVVHDIMEPLPEELIGRFDWVTASHVLEHISWRDVVRVMSFISQALKKDGFLCFVVPDFGYACRQVTLGNYGMDVLGNIFGGQSNEWQVHKVGFTKGTMQVALDKIGYKVIGQITRTYNIQLFGGTYSSREIETLAAKNDGQNPDPTS